MLTKKECEKALEHFEECYWNQDCSYGAMSRVRKDLDILNKLIHEHFSNPPLKFEELQERETYYHIYYGWISIRSISDCECILINTLNSDGYKQIEFEEDCFYRKEVQE